MLNQGIIEINNLNTEFYQRHNESFDKSRFMEWEGFLDALKYLSKNSKILDLGCGNGRFLEFLTRNNAEFNSYLGVDNSKEFIEKNKLKFINYNFEQKDIVIEDFTEFGKYDLITIFGVTHHIPYEEYRKEWFKKISNHISKGGYLIVSFWNFDPQKSDKKFSPKTYKPEKNDYFLGWKNNFENHRFCHLFSEKELSEIVSNLEECELVEKFVKDQNTYLILKKRF